MGGGHLCHTRPLGIETPPLRNRSKLFPQSRSTLGLLRLIDKRHDEPPIPTLAVLLHIKASEGHDGRRAW